MGSRSKVPRLAWPVLASDVSASSEPGEERTSRLDDDVPDPRGLLPIEAMLERARAYALLGLAAPEPRVGRFIVRSTLGRGAMGVVLAAHDPRLDRKVALKLLDLLHGAKDAALREARALARVSHPNIVGIYEVDETDGTPYIAMELVEGTTLRAWLEREGAALAPASHATPAASGPGDRLDVVRMFLAVGEGLLAAHAAGIVHGDLKPDNVLVGRDGRPRIVDFGLSRVRDGGDAPGGTAGTPAYMAPEQWRAIRPADERSDQYAFCVALFEALYLRRPFEGASLAELEQRVLAGEPAPVPSGQQVAQELHAAILRGLARDPAARWPSMSELVDRLRSTLDHAQPGLFRDSPTIVMRTLAPLNVLVPLGWFLLELSGVVRYSALAWLWVSTVQICLLATVLALLRRRLVLVAGTPRVLVIPMIFIPLLLAHRVVALATGRSIETMFVYDFLVVATLGWGAALLLERDMWLVAAVGLTLATLGSLEPARAPHLWLGFILVVPLLVLLVDLRKRRRRARRRLGGASSRASSFL